MAPDEMKNDSFLFVYGKNGGKNHSERLQSWQNTRKTSIVYRKGDFVEISLFILVLNSELLETNIMSICMMW